jgi:hypothetical protein
LASRSEAQAGLLYINIGTKIDPETLIRSTLHPVSASVCWSMTGVGGGSLMTPLLILLFGIHPSTCRPICHTPRRPRPAPGAWLVLQHSLAG